MKIESLYYGEIEIAAESMISFPHGLPGFEVHHQFALLPIKEVKTLFFLQSLKEKGICFTLADPEPYFQDYQPDFSLEDMDALQAEADDEIHAYVILTIPEDFKKTTANLLSPILINISRSLGVQIIPGKSGYTTKHPLFPDQGMTQTASTGGK